MKLLTPKPAGPVSIIDQLYAPGVDLWTTSDRYRQAVKVFGFTPLPGTVEWCFGKTDAGVTCVRSDGGMLAPVPFMMRYAIVPARTDIISFSMPWPLYVDQNVCGEGSLRGLVRLADRSLGPNVEGRLFKVAAIRSGYELVIFPDSLVHSALYFFDTMGDVMKELARYEHIFSKRLPPLPMPDTQGWIFRTSYVAP